MKSAGIAKYEKSAAYLLLKPALFVCATFSLVAMLSLI